MSTVSEHRRRAARAAFEQVYSPDSDSVAETPTNPEQPAAEAGEPTYKYISEWVRDCTCGVCGQTFGQLNYFLGLKALGRGESRAIAGFCTTSSEPLPPRPGRFEDRWTPSECPNCEAARRAQEEERSATYLGDDPHEPITITFEPDEAVLVLDSMEELSETGLANLRAAGKVSIAIGSPLENLRVAFGEEHFSQLLEAGKIISTEGSN